MLVNETKICNFVVEWAEIVMFLGVVSAVESLIVMAIFYHYYLLKNNILF